MRFKLKAVVWLLSLAASPAAELTFPLAASLSPEKDSYRLREKITFTVTVKNTSQNPVPILVRGRNGKEPLGKLELYSEDPKLGKVGFDVCSLFCGTDLQNGILEPGAEVAMEISIAENATWGPPAPYHFVFRVASAQARRNEPYKFQASSNVAKVEIVP
jgi:hypothetical protein